MQWLDALAGIAVALGLAIFTGGDKWLEARVVQVLPDRWGSFTTGI